jgi:DNA repair ATPase RecN
MKVKNERYNNFMDLKEYIKNINDYLIAEDFSEGTSETMEDKSKQLQDLKTRFEEFLKKLEEAGTSLEEIQKAAAEQGGGSTDEAAPAQPQGQQAPAQPQAQPAPAAPAAQPQAAPAG